MEIISYILFGSFVLYVLYGAITSYLRYERNRVEQNDKEQIDNNNF